MKNFNFKKIMIFLLSATLVAGIFAGCGKSDTAIESSKNIGTETNVAKHLKIAAAPGPYGDMFDEAIKPYLEEKLGYTVDISEYSDGNAAHQALLDGDLDSIIIGHLIYEKSMEKNLGKVITPIYVVPTAGAGIYSQKYKLLSEIKDGSTISVANDTTNFPRALRILQAAGLIKLDPNVDPFIAIEADILENPHKLKLKQIESAQAARSMESVDLAIIHGNYAFATGLDLKSALYTEVLGEEYKNCLVVDNNRVKEQFVKDIQEAASSDEFWKILNTKGTQYEIFQKPKKSIPDKFYTDQGLEVPK
ncbi:MAG TPA: MetQ/NlpA family ABC transporter substrate-binding protein [Ruminiclostridium sp.]